MRACKVFIHGREAGILTETSAPVSYEFRYLPQYIESEGAAVCLSMPLCPEPYYSAYLFPYFFNMLSEGSNREIQAQLWHLDKRDDFGIMMATAQHDTPGAVTILPITSIHRK